MFFKKTEMYSETNGGPLKVFEQITMMSYCEISWEQQDLNGFPKMRLWVRYTVRKMRAIKRYCRYSDDME